MKFFYQNKSNFPHKNSCGFIVIEAVASVVIGAIILTAFSALIFDAIKVSRVNQNELKATLYLQELIEIAKDLEKSNWDLLANSNCTTLNVCHPEAQTSTWNLVSGEECLDNTYCRSLTIENVCRNTNNEITSCGVDEPSTTTKKVIATITWNDGFQNRTSILETYVYSY